MAGPNANTLNGLLQSLQVEISAEQLLALPKTPVPLIGNPGPGLANLVVRLIASLRFNTTPYSAGQFSVAQLLYGGPSRVGVDLDTLSLLPEQLIYPLLTCRGTAVANASGGNTVYTTDSMDLAAIAPGALVGLPCTPEAYSHGGNNYSLSGSFVIIGNTATTLTIGNPNGVAEASPPAGAAVTVFGNLQQAGAGGSVDLGTLLVQTADAIQVFDVESTAFPRSEIENCAIFLGTASGGLTKPTNFANGDGTLLLTIIYLQVEL